MGTSVAAASYRPTSRSPAPGGRPQTDAPGVLPVERGASAEEQRRVLTAQLLMRAGASRGTTREGYEDEVIRLNMPVARELAHRYHRRGIPAEDIDQVAYLGLVKAVRGFDPAQGQDFLSYAVPTVRGEIRRYFRDAGWTVRPPRSVQEVQARVLSAEAELYQRLGRSPRPSEIAELLDVPLPLVIDALAASGCFTPLSLDAPRPEGEQPSELIGGEDPALASAEARLALRPLLATLTDRERRILALRFFENRTQAQIGAEVGVTQEQVSRLLSGILLRLRRRLAA